MISFFTYFILFVVHCLSLDGPQLFANNQLLNADVEFNMNSKETIRLECRFNGIIQWILPNNTEYKDYSNPMVDGRCKIETMGNQSILTLKDLRYTDTGLYKCVTHKYSNESEDESTFSTRMEIGAYVFIKDDNPNHLFMHFISSTLIVYKDRESYINCMITDPNAKAELLIDDEAKTNFKYDKQKGFRVPVGSLEQLRVLHEMKCVATNPSTNTTDSLIMLLLMIERKPNTLIVNIYPDNADKLFYLSNQLKLQCDVANYELTECIWSYPPATNVHEEGRMLFLDSISWPKNGTYKCICKNLAYPEQIASAEIFGIVRKNKFIRVNEKGQTLKTRANEIEFYANVDIFVPAPINRDMISAQWFHNYSTIHFGSIAVNSFGVNVRILDELNISMAMAKTDVSGGVNLMNKLLKLTLQDANVRQSGEYSVVVKAGDAVETVTFSLLVNSIAVVELYVTTDIYSQKKLNSTYLEKDKTYKVWCIAEGIPLQTPHLSFCPCVIDKNETCDESCINIKEDSDNGGLQVQKMTGTYQSAIVVSQNAVKSGTFICTVQSSKIDIPFIVTDIVDSQEMSGFSLEMERSAFRHEDKYEVYEHDNATIICKIQKYEDKGGVLWYFKPNSESVWRVLAVQGLDKAKGSNFSHIYQWALRNIQLNQYGTYRCTRNGTEQQNTEYRERLVKVTPSTKPSERYSALGNVLHFHYSTNAAIVCGAQGIPFPKIKWIKDGEPLNLERYRLSDRDTTITIDTVIAEDEGKYVCTMTNPSGTSTAEYIMFVTGLPPQRSNLVSIALLIVADLVITWLIVLIVTRLALKREIQKLRNLHRCLQNNMDLDDRIDPDKPINAQPGNLTFDSAYSIPASFLDMDNKVGLDDGNFGVVFKVPLKSSDQLHVAVKEIKRKSVLAHTALVSEAKIMMYIGNHVNVLSLIGAFITEIPNGVQYIATEFCAKGSLSNFLQNRCKRFIPENATVVTGQNNRSFAGAAAPVRYKIVNFVRHLLHKDVDSDSVLATSDLLCFAYQIANGMMYLVSKNIIHRDLAARNILLTNAYLVRIADFGLARNTKIYHAQMSRRFGLPFQHMAPESVNNYVFSMQSDVWSFGILLSEVFSLGSHPFPDLDLSDPIAVAQFKGNLKTGTLKPPIPENTPSALAHLMKKCWELEGANRPDYEECRSVIEECLNSHCADCHDYLAAALNANADKTPVLRLREELARVQSREPRIVIEEC